MLRKFHQTGQPEFSPIWSLAFGLLIFIVLVSAPVGFALEIHHMFAEVDLDGHQHTDFDLCQWVQFHTAYSLAGEDPAFGPGTYFWGVLSHAPPSLVTSPFPFLSDSRGPPFSSMI